MDLFTVAALNRVVDAIVPANTYLLRTFFPGLLVSQEETIYFDVLNGSRRLAPFVAPIVQGQIVEKRGYVTKSFKPAYVKDKRVFLPNAPIRRIAGERIGGSLGPAERLQALVASELQDQQDMLQRRLEVMAGEVLATGAETIKGDYYPETIVDFGRHADLSVSLSGTNEWGDTGVDPLASLRTWQGVVHSKSGIRPNRVTMTPDAWELFQASESVVKIMDRVRSESTIVDPVAPAGDDGWFGGRIAGFEIYVYQGEYVDPLDNTAKNILPDYTVILGDNRIEGVKAFGAIQDHEAGLQARESYTKSWVEKDPSVRYIMMQSAPLIVPFRPDAMLSAVVKQ